METEEQIRETYVDSDGAIYFVQEFPNGAPGCRPGWYIAKQTPAHLWDGRLTTEAESLEYLRRQANRAEWERASSLDLAAFRALTESSHHVQIIHEQPTDGMAVEDLRAEIDRARSLFPGHDRLFLALSEEVGELANAILEGKEWRTEALHVATVAMRIYIEGKATHGLEVKE